MTKSHQEMFGCSVQERIDTFAETYAFMKSEHGEEYAGEMLYMMLRGVSATLPCNVEKYMAKVFHSYQLAAGIITVQPKPVHVLALN